MNAYKIAVFTVVALLLFVGVTITHAQNDCGDGLPCGRIPWDLPAFPAVPSPTPMPTIPVTLAPPTPTPGGPTATPAPTNEGFDIDMSGINDQFATLQSLAEATEPVVEVSGTPVAAGEQLTSLAEDSYTFFGYVRGIGELDLGGLTPLLGFIILSFVVVVAVKSITFLLPVLIAIFNFVKSVISLVLDFLPF